MRRLTRTQMGVVAGVVAIVASLTIVQALQNRPWPPPVVPDSDQVPALTAEQQLATMIVPPGYRVELVAKEPMIQDPIVMDWDLDGRMWVIEMPGFAQDMQMRNSRDPICRVVVLEDTNNDGTMDKRTVFADGLVLPRALKTLDTGTALVGEPPNLWLMKDTNGDLKMDTKELVANTYGSGTASIEHNANSLLWAMDNRTYTSEHSWHMRYVNGKFETVPALSRGQWGAAQDDAGRVYRNVNSAPLFMDFVAPHYYMRNPNQVRTRGLYEPMISIEDAVVWPARPTKGVNRGYRDQFFRPDGSSMRLQGLGGVTVYRGDRLPREQWGNVYIADSTTNLVHRFVIVDNAGHMTARDGYAKGEILASTDERFRPAELSSGPDGTLYVVDIYRGVTQEVQYQTDYLREYIDRKKLQMPVNLGRIWRITHQSTQRDRNPSFSTATPQDLVQALSHPNGWWRDKAQQLLVLRNASSVAPALRDLSRTSTDWRVKLHALWTLDGLSAIEPADAERALTDASPDVRAAGVRLSERWVRTAGHPLTGPVLKLSGDANWKVRRQLAATIGELPEAARVEPAALLLSRYGGDAILVDITMSSLAGLESEVLGRVTQAAAAGQAEAVTMLAATVARRADATAVQRILDQVTDTARPAWLRTALLRGLDTGLVAAGGAGGGGGRGGGGGGGRGGGRGGGAAAARGVTLPAEPAALTRLAATASGDTKTLASSVAGKLDWPGKPAPVVTVPPLTAEEQKRFDAGRQVYANLCVACHQPDGRGREKVAPSLVGSRYVTGDANTAARVVLAGKEGPVGLMPPLKESLTDEQIAAVLTYVRREWGNTGSTIDANAVRETRQITRGRTRPWTDEELQPAGRGGGGGGGAARGGGAAPE